MEKRTGEFLSMLFKKHLSPPEAITLSQWADKHRRLPAESSAEPGRWRTERTPYLKRIMDCITDPKIRKVVLMFSAQIGKSEVLLNTIGYYAHIEPSPMLMVQPTVAAGAQFSKERIAPTIRDTPIMAEIFGLKRNEKNTVLNKAFPGGYLAIVGANSPVGLASRPIRVILADEVDRWPMSASREGDPLTIVEKRTTTFPNTHKLVYVSTPTIDGISRIQYEFEQGSMEVYELPCPSCRAFHELKWANIIFGETILCLCPSCGGEFNEHRWKNQEGRWRSTRALDQNDTSQNNTIKSFHLSSLYSPWKSWRDIVNSFLAAKDDTEMLKVWTNTELGEPWLTPSEGINADELMERAEEYPSHHLPKGVLMLTAGVDVQDNRFELEVVGWGVNKQSWGIEYKVIHGDTSLPETWERLDQHLLKTYAMHSEANTPHKDTSPNLIPITCTTIDSGGHRTSEAYDFCKQREFRGVYAIKGRGGAGMNIVHNVNPTRRVGNQLFIIAVDTAKSTLLSRLAQKDPMGAGYCHFPLDDDHESSRGYDKSYFDGLTSEVRITKMVRGVVKTEWRLKSGAKNEPLDCRVYALAAFEIVNPNLEELAGGQRREVVNKPIGTISRGVEV